MKKLMIAAAIVCAAAFSQAASVQWTANDIATVATQGTESPVALSGAKYFCFLTVDEKEVVSTISVADAVKLVVAKDWEGLAAAAADTKTTTAAGAISSNKISGWGKGDPVVSGFAIILDAAAPADATHYMVTDVATGSAFSQASTTAKIALGSQAGNTWVALGNVPEPTSGLLLLIGVAGLALRRRRA